MTESAEVYVHDNKLTLVGRLDFANAMSVYKASIPVFACSQQEIIVDLAGLMSANSAIMAMIVNWIKLAVKNNKQIRLENLSEDIESLIAASRLNKLIQEHTAVKA
jgi:anti-anti-sigma factor